MLGVQRLWTVHLSPPEHPTPSRSICNSLMPLASTLLQASTAPDVLIPQTGSEGNRKASNLHSTPHAAESYRTACAELPEQRSTRSERKRARKGQLECKVTAQADTVRGGAMPHLISRCGSAFRMTQAALEIGQHVARLLRASCSTLHDDERSNEADSWV